MRKLLIFIVLAAITGLFSCNKDDDTVIPDPVQSETFSDLHAPQEGGMGDPDSGEFTKFSFATGAITTSDTEWDIAFRATTIIVNGGSSFGMEDEPERSGNAAAYIATGTFADVKNVAAELFAQDSDTELAIPAGSGNGWYLYNPETFTIAPIAGRILVFRTHDGKYAKVEILSYYEGAPAVPDAFTDVSRYYTFNYVYQPNDGVTAFE